MDDIMSFQSDVKQLHFLTSKVVIKQLLQMAHAAASIQELFGCIGWQSHFMLVLI
jgi:hypothetical protein